MSFFAGPTSLDNPSLRRALYAGDIFKLPATNGSLELVHEVRRLLEIELGSTDIRGAPSALGADDFFHLIGRIRKQLFTERRYHVLVERLLADAGFAPACIAFDPLRLRVVAHRGHENPRARPVYYPHRDTWYAHPQGILTWWVPLDDLAEHETFAFYPEFFACPVPNDSEIFDYAAWVAKGWNLKIGWQDIEAGRTAKYPHAALDFVDRLTSSEAVGFACSRAENLLFSGAHFHRTLPQATGRCRYSLDFRIVHLADDAQGLGAPNVDNRSRGSALGDYSHPGRGGRELAGG